MIRTRYLAVAVLFATARHSSAQTALVPPAYAEYRADAIVGHGTSLQGGGGITVPLGVYMRLGLIGAVGTTIQGGDASLSGRTDAIARFTFDPFRETAVGFSLGGGVSVPYEQGRRVRPYLTAVIDVEGRRRGAITPALQIGLGGGTRIGLGFRASPANRR